MYRVQLVPWWLTWHLCEKYMWEMWDVTPVESSAVFCLSRIRNKLKKRGGLPNRMRFMWTCLRVWEIQRKRKILKEWLKKRWSSLVCLMWTLKTAKTSLDTTGAIPGVFQDDPCCSWEYQPSLHLNDGFWRSLLNVIMLMIDDLTKDGNRQHLNLSWIVLLLIIDDQTEDNGDVDNW